MHACCHGSPLKVSLVYFSFLQNIFEMFDLVFIGTTTHVTNKIVFANDMAMVRD